MAVDRAVRRSYHRAMPLWHCPHCGTPQPEAARCWVCRKSSTSCVTCRHFRQGVAASLGYCGLDRRHEPLRGDEIRACWDPATYAAPRPLGIGARSSDGAAAHGPTAMTPVAPTADAGATRMDHRQATSRAPLAWHELEDPRTIDAGSLDAARRPGEGDVATPREPRPSAWIQGFWLDPDA